RGRRLWWDGPHRPPWRVQRGRWPKRPAPRSSGTGGDRSSISPRHGGPADHATPRARDTQVLRICSYNPSMKHLPSLGFGAAPIGNLFAEVGEEDAQAALQAAWRGGIRYFDTAPFYGHGL